MKLGRLLALILFFVLMIATLSACRRSEEGVSGPGLEPTLEAEVDQAIQDLDQMLRDMDRDVELLETPVGP